MYNTGKPVYDTVDYRSTLVSSVLFTRERSTLTSLLFYRMKRRKKFQESIVTRILSKTVVMPYMTHNKSVPGHSTWKNISYIHRRRADDKSETSTITSLSKTEIQSSVPLSCDLLYSFQIATKVIDTSSSSTI